MAYNNTLELRLIITKFSTHSRFERSTSTGSSGSSTGPLSGNLIPGHDNPLFQFSPGTAETTVQYAQVEMRQNNDIDNTSPTDENNQGKKYHFLLVPTWLINFKKKGHGWNIPIRYFNSNWITNVSHQFREKETTIFQIKITSKVWIHKGWYRNNGGTKGDRHQRATGSIIMSLYFLN